MVDKTLYTFRKNSREQVLIGLSEFKGTDYISVRVFIDPDSPGGDPIPTRKGITLSIEQAEELLAGIDALRAELVERGLLVSDVS